ncbi:MAG: DUF1292 domain-containing protein [Oscillospiraceae bacterium]|jgi:hypothetical protein|nr:DUF1292 domain-containing protein [Oscillospiraceae bacterium]
MGEGYGGDYVTITDDEGTKFELEHLDTIEVGDNIYMAFLPAQLQEDDDDYGMIILKAVEAAQGEEEGLLETVDDEDELNCVYEAFMEQLFGDEDDEDESEEGG